MLYLHPLSSTREARDFAESKGYPFIEVSALTQANIKELFDLAIREVLTPQPQRKGKKKPRATTPPKPIEPPKSGPHNDVIWCMAIDENYLFSGSRDKTIKQWDVKVQFPFRNPQMDILLIKSNH